MPKNKKDDELKKRIKFVLVIIIGIILFLICVITTFRGMNQAINKEADMTGLVGFSIRKKTDSSGNEEETKVDKEGNIVSEKSISVDAYPIVKLNNHSWDRVNSSLDYSHKVDENGNLVYDDGYTVYCNKRAVNYVVFGEDYENEVMGEITVGTDFEDIIENLGTPTFKTDDYLGYKTKTNYVFFEENEICVYPNRSVSNSDFEELINNYFSKVGDMDRSRFLAEIRNNFEDFSVEYDEENDIATISSTLRKVTAKLNKVGNIEVEFFDGYEYSLDETEEYVNNDNYKTNEDDLVEIKESERIKIDEK